MCEVICQKPQTRVIFEALQQDRCAEASKLHHSSEVTQTVDGQAGRQKQTGKQTDKQGRGNAPESNDANQRLASAAQTQTEQTGGRGSELPFHRLTHSSPLTSHPQPVMNGDVAAFPRGYKKKNNTGGRAAPLPQETLMDGAQ